MIKNFLKKLYLLYVLRPKAAIEFSWPIWLLLNRKPRILFKKNPPALNPLQQKIVAELKKDGLSITHMDELFADQPEIYADICARLGDLLKNAAQDPKKVHFKDLWNTRVFHLDPENGFTRFALSSRIVDIANAYMGMWTRLLLANGYHAAVRPKETGKVYTQRWHRDNHDKKLVVIFIYLTDVNAEGDGALWYIKESHPAGRFGKFFAQAKPYSKKKFPNEEVIDANIPEQYKTVCLGRKGTIIFTDGIGIHRGGYCTEHERVIALTAYASNHRYFTTSRISHPDDVGRLKSGLTEPAAYAAKLEAR